LTRPKYLRTSHISTSSTLCLTGAARSTPGAAHPTIAYLMFLGARRGSVGFAVDGPLVGPVLLRGRRRRAPLLGRPVRLQDAALDRRGRPRARSEEHTSELQSRFELVCRL